MNTFREAHRHVLPGIESRVAAPRVNREVLLIAIREHHGHGPTDDLVMGRVFRQLGWGMLTEEALALLAREYQARASLRERLDAENRALAKRTGAR